MSFIGWIMTFLFLNKEGTKGNEGRGRGGSDGAGWGLLGGAFFNAKALRRKDWEDFWVVVRSIGVWWRETFFGHKRHKKHKKS